MRQRPSCPLPASKTDPVRRHSQKDGPPPPLDPDDAQSEAARCLSLHVCEGCEVCQLLCPDQAVSKDPITKRPVIDLKYCKGCGLCAHLCPKGAIAMVLEQQSD